MEKVGEPFQAGSLAFRYILEALVEGLPPFVSDSKGRLLLSSREQEIVSKVAKGMHLQRWVYEPRGIELRR
jgi:hypothetical protein